MKTRTWLVATLGSAVALAGLVALLNFKIDLFGMFSEQNGQSRLVYGDERVAKYLLSGRYVPTNFNALLIGSSVSANWDAGLITNYRTYNESLNGGNVVEQEAIVDQALERPGVIAAVLLVHPYFTSSHNFETVELTPRIKLGALGSTSLLSAYKNAVNIRLGREEQTYDRFGSNDFDTAARKLNPRLAKMLTSGGDFEIDDIAMQSYFRLIDKLHQRGINILFVVPPTSTPLLTPKLEAFERYQALITPHMTAGDLVLDLNSAEYASLRDNPENYTDGVHMRPAAARTVVAAIDRALGNLRRP
jgi:hypothetical protein